MIFITFLIFILSSANLVFSYYYNDITSNIFSKQTISTSAKFSSTTPLVSNGKRFEAEPGSSMMMACSKLGLKVPTDCKKGDCGTCTVTVGGKKIRACIGKVPAAPKLKSLIEKGLPVTVDN